MPLTQLELELKALAAERINRKLLPAQLPKTLWAGRGSGEPCSLCGRAIDRNETEYELEALPAIGANGIVRLHVRCHGVWPIELAHQSSGEKT